MRQIAGSAPPECMMSAIAANVADGACLLTADNVTSVNTSHITFATHSARR